jgi:hypothetical protein
MLAASCFPFGFAIVCRNFDSIELAELLQPAKLPEAGVAYGSEPLSPQMTKIGSRVNARSPDSLPLKLWRVLPPL